ncbi:phosphoadenosine phosphosulfate reductase family protein [Lutimonas sp.]|uniref:phosphoadenosine phosphosulfate reductase domain-containing protein n=1 Tax=Lutimonas sp. TaxID=1872403 RepID=UPI003D9AEEC6
MIQTLKELDLAKANKVLKELEPVQIIEWTMQFAEKPMLTTNFGPYSASLVHAVNRIDKNINVVWCDSGHNTKQTYKFALDLIDRFALNMHIYKPRPSSVYNKADQGIPFIDTPAHRQFTEEVKLEPFRRALKEHQPDVWFTNLRSDQSEHRSTLDILHLSKEGILKVSPFFHYSEFDLELYLQEYGLPNEKRYYDPTKVLAKRECGLHL